VENLKYMKNKLLIYSPYFDGVGGGERYMLSTAECFLKNNWQVDVLWSERKKILEIGKKLELDLSGVRVLGKKPEELSFWRRLSLSRSYDLIFWLSNGSLPVLFGQKNILHFQQPFQNIGGKKIINQIKLGLINEFVCNSKFTKKFIDIEFGVDSEVLYPPVDIDHFKPGNKENIILAVGRFEPSKKQDSLIDAFRGLLNQGVQDWRLVFIGGSLSPVKDNDYLKKLKKEAQDLPIDFHVNAKFSLLKEYYQKAKLFWHAKGYNVSEDSPKQMEHFGITPVEAMSAGCVPLVVDKGGLREIVRREEGERWKNLKELRIMSYELIKDEEKYKKYQQKAMKRAKKFSKQKFCQRLYELTKNS